MVAFFVALTKDYQKIEFNKMLNERQEKTDRDSYFEFYDDIKTSIKEDW